jgi:hypothetical protein
MARCRCLGPGRQVGPGRLGRGVVGWRFLAGPGDGWGREAAAHVVRGRAGPTCLRCKGPCDWVGWATGSAHVSAVGRAGRAPPVCGVICPFAIIKYGFRPNTIIKMGFAATPFSIIVQQTKCHFIPSAHYNLRPFNAVNCTNKSSVRKLAHRLFQPRFKKNVQTRFKNYSTLGSN